MWPLRKKVCKNVSQQMLAGVAHGDACCADAKHHLPIHREAPPFVEQSTEQEILVTGIKVCDCFLLTVTLLLVATCAEAHSLRIPHPCYPLQQCSVLRIYFTVLKC